MNYFMKLDLEDQIYLLSHSDGYKCWQTDYKLLRGKSEMDSLINYLEDRALQGLQEELHPSDQKNLFPLK